MKQPARELQEEARDLRAIGEFGEAGDVYTRAAHEFAGIRRRSFPEPDYTRSVLGALLYAATCYRIAGDVFRMQNRCELGELVAADYRAYIDDQEVEPGTFADLRRGAWPEFVGDLRTIAEQPDADEAYDEAVAIYDAAGDFDVVYAEQEHTRLAGFYRNVRTGIGEDVGEQDPEQLPPGVSFIEWVEYKRERLPELLNQLELTSTWS